MTMMLGKPCCWMMQLSMMLLIIGGLNWGLVAVEGKDLFALLDVKLDILGTPIAKVVYALVGIAAVYILLMKANIIEKASDMYTTIKRKIKRK